MTIKKKYNEITNHLVIMLEKKKNTILIGGKNTFNNYKYPIRNYNLNVRSTLNLNFEERLNYSFFFFFLFLLFFFPLPLSSPLFCHPSIPSMSICECGCCYFSFKNISK